MATSRNAPARAPARRTGAIDARSRIQAEAARLDAEKEQRKQRAGEPHRFFVTVGEEREFVIIDEHITFMRREHVLQDGNGKYRNVVPCTMEEEDCPVCAQFPDRQSTLNLLLTVIDLTPFENSQGETIEWSKKLLVVKPGQHKIFTRWEDREQNLRGLIIRTARDNKTDFAIGNDMEIVGEMSEEDLLTYETSYENREGETIDVLGHEPYDYEEIFPQLDAVEVCKLAGIQHRERAGSRAAVNRDIDRTERGGRDRDNAQARRPAGRATGRSDPADNAPRRGARRPADDPPQDPVEDAPRTARTARRGAAAAPENDPPQRGARRAARGGEDDTPPWREGDEEGADPTNDVQGARGDDAPAPARRGAARRGAAPAAAPAPAGGARRAAVRRGPAQ